MKTLDTRVAASGEWPVYADMVAGSCATMMHDGVSTPVDVVKQVRPKLKFYAKQIGFVSRDMRRSTMVVAQAI